MTTYTFNPAALKAVLTSTTENMGAVFTVRSTATGKDFSYRLKRAQMKDGQWYTFVYVEMQYMEFHYVGFYKQGFIIRKGLVVDTPASKAISWCLNRVEVGKDLSMVQFFHIGKCLKCGRTLTDSISIEAGLGPICRGL